MRTGRSFRKWTAALVNIAMGWSVVQGSGCDLAARLAEQRVSAQDVWNDLLGSVFSPFGSLLR